MLITAAPLPERALDRLAGLIDGRRLLVITGAGVSTASGIPDYRDRAGQWKRPQPVQYQTFVRDETARQRYWARSLVGWRWFGSAEPNPAHRALARLEESGRIHHLVTQNVDRLHQRAGSRRVVDLHGRLDRLICLDCRRQYPRAPFQAQLAAANPGFAGLTANIAPDGDADLEGVDLSGFRVPGCAACGGLLKPHVVFFGEAVPKARVARTRRHLDRADALLVIGSSLMVFSGFRFAREAAARHTPIYAINQGRTRADDMIDCKIEAPCGPALVKIAERLDGH